MTSENRFRERRTAYQDEGSTPPEVAAAEPSGTTPPPADVPSPPTVEPAPPLASEPSPAPVASPPQSPPAQPPDAAREATLAEPDESSLGPAVDLDELDQIEIPDASFFELVQPLEIQALQFLGEIPLSPAGEKRVMRRWAKHVIDLLGILEARTQGQLAEDEAQYLKQVLDDLRVRYLRISP